MSLHRRRRRLFACVPRITMDRKIPAVSVRKNPLTVNWIYSFGWTQRQLVDLLDDIVSSEIIECLFIVRVFLSVVLELSTTVIVKESKELGKAKRLWPYATTTDEIFDSLIRDVIIADQWIQAILFLSLPSNLKTFENANNGLREEFLSLWRQLVCSVILSRSPTTLSAIKLWWEWESQRQWIRIAITNLNLKMNELIFYQAETHDAEW